MSETMSSSTASIYTQTKTQKKFEEMTDEFDVIQGDMNEFDISMHLAKVDDLPNLGNIEVYDYQSDLKVVEQKGMEVLESLVDLYLGEFPELRKHSYIRNKIKEDAMVYAESLFLQQMTRKNFLTQLRQIDNGDNSARMHEVVNQTIREIRENITFKASQINGLEKFYKDFRQDLIEVTKVIGTQSSNHEEEGEIIDNAKLNEMINAVKNKK